MKRLIVFIILLLSLGGSLISTDSNITRIGGWGTGFYNDVFTMGNYAYIAAGWNGLASPADFGGQELPHAVNAACVEMWNSASMAFGIGPVLTMAAVDALNAYGSDDLKARYLEKLISGEWMGTMQLTEPQAGSDVGALRTKAERAANPELEAKIGPLAARLSALNDELVQAINAAISPTGLPSDRQANLDKTLKAKADAERAIHDAFAAIDRRKYPQMYKNEVSSSNPAPLSDGEHVYWACGGGMKGPNKDESKTEQKKYRKGTVE